ncbi:probable LRR receptor-like serine/threonine-protein kinase At4g31250 [Olea europaea var. sylvestris]|uniref:probable LRR receptor-like serine/threonine-protein kinase At4g31250 n=1 Tax=Olea europaea var. sylvestris TaxID=158386 RepID=UPI000C1D5228|nr:probable LRR receptor-like serine/threonine-protein kinase At4g31250 [Olea europaea var. sylvestris]
MAYTLRNSFFVFFASFLCAITVSSDDESYAKILIKFKSSLSNTNKLNNWIEPVENLCNGNTPKWTGLVCDNGTFTGIKLENMSLEGTVDVDSLAELPLLSLSLMNNNFSGPFPYNDLKKLGKLRSLYLANNSFNGDIPDDTFSGMKAMRKIVLGYNEHTGKIPMSLLKLPRLVNLQLQNNQIEGRIPDFRQKDLNVNFANNKLEGPIPSSLSSQNASSFTGNTNLCGKPLDPCKPKKSIPKIAIIIAAVVGVALAAIIMALICRRRSRPLKYEKSVEIFPAEEPTDKGTEHYKNNGEQRKLYFVRNDRERFELENLLKASAEVLGSGNFGSSYKAVLSNGQPFVVRRFQQMNNVGNGEFYEHMSRLGRLSHPNLLPLVAFYHGKEEKLLITDFVPNGSLASHLHGERSRNQSNLNWPTRLKIIKGVARGLAYLYKELPSLSLPHGHLKSSNVLLDNTFEPVLSDYALTPVVNKEHAQRFMVAYKSPESTKSDRVTRKTDVWNLGILILELLTGRFPANYLKQGRGPNADLATWVNSVVREEWTGEVFDKDMNLGRYGEGQILRLLKIGMCCCEWNVGRRWDLKEAIEKIEELKERDSDDEYSSYASEGEIYSSRAATDEDFSFSKA